MANECYFNGNIIPENEAHLSINELGVLRGYGVFDVIRIYHGKLFLCQEHLNRFKCSAETIGLTVSLSNIEMENIILELIRRNGLQEATAKLVLTGGESPDGITCDPASPTFFIVVRKALEQPSVIYQQGVKLMMHEYQRSFPSAKTTEYLTLMQLQKRKRELQAYEILYVHQEKVLEGATSVVFFFKGNTLITPKHNILLGVTQKCVIELAQPHFAIEERDIGVSEVKQMSEAFIASTNRDIVPVVAIDEHRVGDGRVGSNTKQLMQLFKEFINQ